jgi:hypothetical protein
LRSKHETLSSNPNTTKKKKKQRHIVYPTGMAGGDSGENKGIMNTEKKSYYNLNTVKY